MTCWWLRCSESSSAYTKRPGELSHCTTRLHPWWNPVRLCRCVCSRIGWAQLRPGTTPGTLVHEVVMPLSRSVVVDRLRSMLRRRLCVTRYASMSLRTLKTTMSSFKARMTKRSACQPPTFQDLFLPHPCAARGVLRTYWTSR